MTPEVNLGVDGSGEKKIYLDFRHESFQLSRDMAEELGVELIKESARLE